ncbi:MAG TPA: TetR/AcrR family transcriptional regulator [Nitrososphaeraceae archaeon]|jgi:AcrR family transcriptional regulator|nr:TetR/AcrR family transcriptional regulator [Nitrososphaeraceae archaeon]
MTVKDEEILKAAMKTIVREGYDGATTKLIADEAGINEVTLFRKFHSKENILQAVIMQQRDNALQALTSAFLSREVHEDDKGNAPRIATTLTELGDRLIEFMKTRMDLMILLMSEGRRKPSVAKVISSIPQDMIVQLRKLFEEQMRLKKIRDVDPQLAAVTFLGFLFYYSLMKELFNDKVIKENKGILDGFVDIFLNGVRIAK